MRSRPELARRIGDFAFSALLVSLAFVLYPLRMFKRHRREYGLTAADRSAEIRRKFGAGNLIKVETILDGVRNPTDQVLGAIVFLATRLEQLPGLVELANADQEQLLRAAVVKDERG